MVTAVAIMQVLPVISDHLATKKAATALEPQLLWSCSHGVVAKI
jgi:hypothetical protein